MNNIYDLDYSQSRKRAEELKTFLLELDSICDTLYNKFKPGHPGGFVEALSNYYFDIAEYCSNPSAKSKEEIFGLKESIEGLKMFHALSQSFVQAKWISIE